VSALVLVSVARFKPALMPGLTVTCAPACSARKQINNSVIFFIGRNDLIGEFIIDVGKTMLVNLCQKHYNSA
jgi:hypothetical protein